MANRWSNYHYSDAVAAIRDAAEAELGDAAGMIESGPGHVVFADSNLDDDNIDFCMAACDETHRYADRWSPEELQILKKWLGKLKEIPEEQRWGDD